jgi:hypothetical protein
MLVLSPTWAERTNKTNLIPLLYQYYCFSFLQFAFILLKKREKQGAFFDKNTRFLIKNHQKTGKNKHFLVDFGTKIAVFRLKSR